MKKDHKGLNIVITILSFLVGCFAMGIGLQNRE